MEQLNFADARVLIVGAQGYAALMLRTVLAACGINRIEAVAETHHALQLLCVDSFDAMFLEEQSELDGVPFVLAARRTPRLVNPMMPIFVVYSGARRCDVVESRDLGFNDVIVRPVSPKTIKEKLSAALVSPRSFIAAPEFFGPDRRAKMRKETTFGGKERRLRVPKKQKLQIPEA